LHDATKSLVGRTKSGVIIVKRIIQILRIIGINITAIV